MAARCEFITHSFGQILDQPPIWELDLNYCFLQSENLAGPIAADQIRPHIVRDRAVRAWLGEDGGRAPLPARLHSCSQASAELLLLLLDMSHSVRTAVF